jgi:sporulation-control protein
MLKNFLASVGIGSAKVDAYIETENLVPGANCDVNIVIKASESVSQDINGLVLALCTSAKSDHEIGDSKVNAYNTVVLGKWALKPTELGMSSSILEAGKVIEGNITIKLPDETPVSTIGNGQAKVWLATGLDIAKGLDSSDKDFLPVEPTEFQENTLNAMIDLGYQLFKVDVEMGHVRGQGFASQVGCYQEFEFKKKAGMFSSSEVEVTFVHNGNDVGLLVEKDRFLGGDAYFSAVMSRNATFEQIKATIQRWI